jgi:hypothetical protein
MEDVASAADGQGMEVREAATNMQEAARIIVAREEESPA